MRSLIFILLIFCIACARKGGHGDGDMMVEKITVRNLEFVSNQGQAWDNDGSGPDLQIELVAPGASKASFTSAVSNNVRAGALPLTIEVNDHIELTDGQWGVLVYDVDDKSREVMDLLDFDGETVEDNTLEVKSAKGKATTIIIEFAEH